MTDKSLLGGKAEAARLLNHLRLFDRDRTGTVVPFPDFRKMLKQSAMLRRARHRLHMLRARGQSDETEIVERLAIDCPKTFIEFGFHPTEFNCLPLARKPDWQGLLVDGSQQQVEDAKFFFPDRISAVQKWLTLDNIDFLTTAFPALGVLSIDVDGNDYWFLQRLIAMGPAVICVEYNSTFGTEPITVPYDPSFDRHEKQPQGWYHGASLTALALLCAGHGYGLAAVSDGGANAFFTRDGKMDPVTAWHPNTMRAAYSGVGHAEQWEAVKHLPFITVS